MDARNRPPEKKTSLNTLSHKAGLSQGQLVFSPDGSLLTIDAHDRAVLCSSTPDSRPSRNIAVDQRSQLCLSPRMANCLLLEVLVGDGLRFGTFNSRNFVQKIEPAVVDRIAFTPDGNQLVTCMLHLGLGLWDVKTGTQVRPHVTAAKNWPKVRPGQVRRLVSAAISSDAKLVAVPDYCKREIRIFDVQHGVLIATIRTRHHPVSLAFARDVRTLAVGTIEESRNLSEHSEIELWDIPEVLASVPGAHSPGPSEDNPPQNP